jgi:hypothetical protein
MNILVRFLVLLGAATGFAHVAQAIPQLRVFDGTTTVVITDNAAGDSSATAGRIVWDGSIGNWSLNTHVGTAFPILGTLANPLLDLSFNAVTTIAGGTLTLSFSENGFGPTTGTALASIGGTTQGTVVYQTFGGTTNTTLNTTNLLTTQGPFAGAFSGSASSSPISTGGPYSLTQVVTMTHAGAGITTGNILLGLSVPDSGNPAILLGAILAGLGVVARLRQRAVRE